VLLHSIQSWAKFRLSRIGCCKLWCSLHRRWARWGLSSVSRCTWPSWPSLRSVLQPSTTGSMCSLMIQGAPYVPQGSSPHLRLKLQGDLEPSQSTLQHLLGCPSGSRGKQFSWMLLAFPFYHLQTTSLESRVVCATCTRILYGRQLSRTVSRVAISPLPKMDGFYRPHNSRSKLRRLSSVSTRPTQLPVQTALIASW